MIENKKIILFDGVCNLCNGAIQFMIEHDTNDVFRYAPLQSGIGRKLLEERKIDTEKNGFYHPYRAGCRLLCQIRGRVANRQTFKRLSYYFDRT